MKILITAPYNEQGREKLANELGEVIYKEWKQNGRAYNEQELNELLDISGADALITEHDHVTAAVIDKHPHLRFIGVCRKAYSRRFICCVKTGQEAVQFVKMKSIASILFFRSRFNATGSPN